MISEWKEKRDFYKYLWAFNSDTVKFYIGNNENRYSPYMEVNTQNINQSIKESNEVVINPYIRFYNIFKCYAVEGERNVDLENNIFQILRNIDYIRGTTIVQMICENIEKDIENEIYGSVVKKKYFEIKSKVTKEKILMYIYKSICNEITDRKTKKYNIKKYMKYYFLVMKNFFEKNIIYKMVNNNFEYVVFLNYSKSQYNLMLLSLLEELFLPIDGNNIKYYWKNHFNVIEVKSVAKIQKNTVF